MAALLLAPSANRPRDGNQHRTSDPRTALFSWIAVQAPSSKAVVENLPFRREWGRIVINRPEITHELPVTLLRRVFGEFVDACEAHQPSCQDYDFAQNLSHELRKFTYDQRVKRDSFNKVLSSYLDMEMRHGTLPRTDFDTDGHIAVDGHCLPG